MATVSLKACLTKLSMSQADLVDDAFELRVQVVLSLEDYVNQGLLIWPGGDETTRNEEDFGTQKK